jgi:hypothetical protein
MKQKSEPKPIDDGGYAFPFNGYQWTEHGMTLRDWMAGQAIQAIIVATSAGQHHLEGDGDIGDLMARDAYALADAMIKARQVKGD